MPVIYQRADEDVMELVSTVARNYHSQDIAEVGANVCVLMASAPRNDKGEPLCDPVKLHGVKCAAIAKIVPYKQRAAGREDVEITVDADNWEMLTEPQRIALIDHELNHFELCRDKETGAPLSDDVGRPKYRTRHHDHDYGWFDCIAARHGEASYEVKQARAFADSSGQLYLFRNDDAHSPPDPVATMPPIVRQQAADLRQFVKDNGATVTITRPGHEPVTIGESPTADAPDPILLDSAARLVISEGRASASLLQRRLLVGYVSASSLMASLAKLGVISVADSKASVVMSIDEWDAAREAAG